MKQTPRGPAPDAAAWIARLGLQPHPEGGHFRETHRSGEAVGECCLPPGFRGPRAMSTAIYYLLEGRDRSVLHRIRSDEVWHFYAGAPLTLHLLEGDGSYSALRLGHDAAAGRVPQAVVTAGTWFGATVDDPARFSLVGCTVSPGFDFRDFELADRERLLRELPQHRPIIERLT